MDFLVLIKNGCDNLTATVAPSVDSLGLHMVISLATIMLVWFCRVSLLRLMTYLPLLSFGPSTIVPGSAYLLTPPFGFGVPD